VGQKRQKLIRSRATDDPVGIEAVVSGEGGAKPRRRAVGVQGERVGGSAERFDRTRARTEWRLVGRKLEQSHAGGRRAAAGHVGGNIQYPVPGSGRVVPYGHRSSFSTIGLA